MAKRRVPVGEQRAAPAAIDFGSSTDEEDEAKAPGPSGDAKCDCPRLEPRDWHEVESDWTDIAFVSGAVFAVAGVPFGYNTIRQKLTEKATNAGARVPVDPMLLLGSGMFRRKALLEIDRVPDGAKVVRPGGVAFTRLVPAPPGKVKKAVKETKQRAKAKYGRDPDSLLLWFLTCHICSNSREFETLIAAHYKERSR